MTSCSDDSKTDWNLAPSLITRSVVTPDFDWENADWMPTPAGYARIPVPWIGAGSLSMKQIYLMITNLLMGGRCFTTLSVQRLLV